jgi:TPR repeat protein
MSETNKVESKQSKMELKQLFSTSSLITEQMLGPESFKIGFHLFQVDRINKAESILLNVANVYGYPPALLILGLIYKKQKKPQLMQQYFAKAKLHQKWFKEQSTKSVLGIFYLATLYEYVPELDLQKKSQSLYLEAANKGLAVAQYKIVKFMQGEERRTWLEAAANLNFAPAQNALALEEYILEDSKRALSLYEKASEQGYASASWNLSYFYREKDPATSLIWLEKAVAQCDDEVENINKMYWDLNDFLDNNSHLENIGRFFDTCKNEDNVDIFLSMAVSRKNHETWCLVAINKGSAEAQCELGRRLLFNTPMKNLKEAEKLFLLAASQGHLEAQERLGDLYRDQNNLSSAVMWYETAAAQETTRFLNVPLDRLRALFIEHPTLANPQRFCKKCAAHNNLDVYMKLIDRLSLTEEMLIIWYDFAVSEGCDAARIALADIFQKPGPNLNPVRAKELLQSTPESRKVSKSEAQILLTDINPLLPEIRGTIASYLFLPHELPKVTFAMESKATGSAVIERGFFNEKEKLTSTTTSSVLGIAMQQPKISTLVAQKK